jgi:hypothetical protein
MLVSRKKEEQRAGRWRMLIKRTASMAQRLLTSLQRYLEHFGWHSLNSEECPSAPVSPNLWQRHRQFYSVSPWQPSGNTQTQFQLSNLIIWYVLKETGKKCSFCNWLQLSTIDVWLNKLIGFRFKQNDLCHEMKLQCNDAYNMRTWQC